LGYKNRKKLTRINPNNNRGELPLDAAIRLAFDEDDLRLAAIQYYNKVNVWNTKTWELIKKFQGTPWDP